MTGLILPESVAKFQKEHPAPSIQVDNIVVTGIDTVRGAIVQNTYAIMDDEVIDTVIQIIETRDEQVMNALITLGWTPPEAMPDQLT